MLQKSSTLIGQRFIVHICDWLTKFKRVYEPSSLLVHVAAKLMHGVADIMAEWRGVTTWKNKVLLIEYLVKKGNDTTKLVCIFIITKTQSN